jgi:hypothetical protein
MALALTDGWRLPKWATEFTVENAALGPLGKQRGLRTRTRRERILRLPSGTAVAALGWGVPVCDISEAKMQIELEARRVGRFPKILFRKKRLTVDIHLRFDMETAKDAEAVKARIEEHVALMMADGDGKIAYTVTDV